MTAQPGKEADKVAKASILSSPTPSSTLVDRNNGEDGPDEDLYSIVMLFGGADERTLILGTARLLTGWCSLPKIDVELFWNGPFLPKPLPLDFPFPLDFSLIAPIG